MSGPMVVLGGREPSHKGGTPVSHVAVCVPSFLHALAGPHQEMIDVLEGGMLGEWYKSGAGKSPVSPDW